MKRREPLLVLCAALASCATTPTPSDLADPVVSTLPAGILTAGRGIVSVTRDRGFTGSGCKYYIYVDSVEVGFVQAGQRLEFGADPGERVVTADVRGICGGGTANVTVNVRADQTTYLRAGATQSGDLRLEPAAPGYR